MIVVIDICQNPKCRARFERGWYPEKHCSWCQMKNDKGCYQRKDYTELIDIGTDLYDRKFVIRVSTS